jgi:glycosidase
MPDRFANGDPSNDDYPGMTDRLDRKENLMRHGGDLQGIIDHLDYFTDLGVTALWLNPALENDMPRESYHGYAITDLYRVDRRLGDNMLYKQLVRQAHVKGLKVIMDMVVNHIGTNNYLIRDRPMDDFVHQFPEFTRTNYRGIAQLDPYASDADRDLMMNGWFDHTMADLNQRNPLAAKYLIQNTIWWVEYAGIDGIRMDTYSYPDKGFLAQWAETVQLEYPSLNIVGEVWENKATTQAYWLSGANQAGDYDSHIHSVTDFVLQDALSKAFTEEESWHHGLARIYYTLTEDRIYPDPNVLVTFIDNHDIARYFSVVGEDLDKMKMGIVALLTLRGIPQWYYGSELGFTGWSHGEVRPEMYGGWADHTANAFTGTGLTEEERELLAFTRNMLQWRKTAAVIHKGELMHFVPENKTYVYFRYSKDAAVMVAFNLNDHSVDLALDRFAERLEGYTSAENVIYGGSLKLDDKLVLAPQSVAVLELKK